MDSKKLDLAFLWLNVVGVLCMCLSLFTKVNGTTCLAASVVCVIAGNYCKVTRIKNAISEDEVQ